MNYKGYSKEFEVHYYEVNRYNDATPVSILNYLGEAAWCHSESVGLGMHKLRSEGMAWILSRWTLIMNKYPKFNDKITIETWPSDFERFYATREFLIKDLHGDILGKASSLWIYFNIEKRRPSRIPSHYGDMYSLNENKAIDTPFEEFSIPEDIENIKNFQVRKHDIDSNNHVNNAKYLEWLIECMPDQIYENSVLNTLEIIYKKEITYGTTICSKQKILNEDNGSKQYIHNITSSENNTDHAVARTTWINR